jgi:hypothetical protein
MLLSGTRLLSSYSRVTVTVHAEDMARADDPVRMLPIAL